MSSSSRSSTSSLCSDDSDQPSSTSYDGSHLSWRAFRREVLTSHQIRVLDSTPKDRIPSSFLQMFEAANDDSSRFDEQRICFWNQVATGRGFGSSPIFPPNLLPPLTSEPLSRCMVPSFSSREALPERAVNHAGPMYDLSVPHPSLVCGFSAAAFLSRELSLLPQSLQATGTMVHWDSGYLNAGAATYCPFLTFERAYGNKEHRVEAANNQCAITGSYCVRALQMLYARAFRESSACQSSGPPVSFSCAIDNSFALINLHWLDLTDGQTYYMAPLCQFDLSKDKHFNKFLVWTQVIGDWALAYMFPILKDALERLSRCTSPVTPAPFFPIHRTSMMQQTRLRLDTGTAINREDILISSLKATYDDIPWRFEDNPDSGLSSSTASWGSPMVADLNFSNIRYPAVHPPRSNTCVSAPNSSVVARRRIARADPSRSATAASPAYLQDQETIWQKRFNDAMDEIKGLQTQLQAFEREVESLKASGRVEATSKPGCDPHADGLRGCGGPTVDHTPMTPKARVPVTLLGEPLSKSPIIVSSALPLWRCATIAVLAHVVAQFFESRHTRMLVYGCTTSASCLALIVPQPAGISFVKELVKMKVVLFGRGKEQWRALC
ncbi:hypothetical protein A1O7_05054 [Cladophialophora yegresii CBS 114405]|uniref:DUF7924 domain-containing protein n=1 Tax=Cladophialophora yegresii CBS 114405 TaxID=1182544 RepID=W9W8P7_9EURO|nr:uncharacterized protein A1O7_05054 [Cladophialophora yegresii CBS 114405]EXJ60901.1 hypothetical protein A1O7_05054 [Cladophialophora yegresii CBS 114405]